MRKPRLPLSMTFHTWRQAGRFGVWTITVTTLVAVSTLVA